VEGRGIWRLLERESIGGRRRRNEEAKGKTQKQKTKLARGHGHAVLHRAPVPNLLNLFYTVPRVARSVPNKVKATGMSHGKGT